MLCPKCERDIPDDAVLCCYCGRVFIKKKPRGKRPNGAGYVRKRGNKYEVAVVIGWIYDETKNRYKPDRPTKGGFATQKEAMEYAPVLRAEALAARSSLPSAATDEKTVSYYWEIIKAQLENKGVSKLKAYGYAYDKLSAIHSREVSSLVVKELQEIVDEKATTYYPAKDMKTVLSKVYALALADEVVTVDKSKSIVLPSLEEEESEPFTAEELKKQWEAFERGYTFVGYMLLMDYTGMMPVELFNCKKSMIDLEKREIIGAGKKTKKRKEAPILFPDFLVPVIETLIDYSPSEKLLPMNRDNFYKKFKEVVVEIGCRELTPYSCRHTTGTALALGENVAPATVQKALRQSSYKSTQRYLHPSHDDVREAFNSLEKPT